jgi:hypothetical protein
MALLKLLKSIHCSGPFDEKPAEEKRLRKWDDEKPSPPLPMIKSLKDCTKEAVIVVFKPTLAGSPHEICSSWKVEHDIHPDFIYHSAVKGFASKIEAHKIEFLISQPHILRIEKDHILHIWPHK